MKRLFALLTLLLISSTLKANMLVYPMELNVGKSGAAKISIDSKSDKVQFIKVYETKIIHPGTGLEKEIAMDASNDSLAVTPVKLALSPGAERIVRLISFEPPEKETTWRVYFEAVSEDEFNEVSGKSQKSSADVGVSIIWGALIHVLPSEIKASIIYEPGKKALVNNGTIRMPITELGTCSRGGACVWSKFTKTIYPDESLPVTALAVNGFYQLKYLNPVSSKVEELTVNSGF